MNFVKTFLTQRLENMKATINNQEINLSKPIDISIPLTNTEDNPIAWYLDKPEIEPVKVGDWIGKVSEGKSSTNFNNIFFNPHGHGTHTECLGHITSHFYSINQCLKQFFFTAQLISVEPKSINGDFVITKEQIEKEVLTLEQTQKYLEGKTPKKIIVVHNKIVNIVV